MLEWNFRETITNSITIFRLLLWVSLVCLAVSASAVTHLSGLFGRFKSPNFPNPYGNDVSKEWRIQVRNGYRIKFKFTNFDLEDSYDADLGGACIYDYVMVSRHLIAWANFELIVILCLLNHKVSMRSVLIVRLYRTTPRFTTDNLSNSLDNEPAKTCGWDVFWFPWTCESRDCLRLA